MSYGVLSREKTREDASRSFNVTWTGLTVDHEIFAPSLIIHRTGGVYVLTIRISGLRGR